MKKTEQPPLFTYLRERGFLTPEQVHSTGDSFFALTVSMAGILERGGVTHLPGSAGRQLDVSLFYDDWYLYAVKNRDNWVYSLFKLREQEYDALRGIWADGDDPGVTVCFVALEAACLSACLESPGEDSRGALARELDRVVARKGQRHHSTLKAYFSRAASQGSYLIAKLYIRHAAAQAVDGVLPLPLHFCRNSRGDSRVADFLAANNAAAGRCVADRERIYLSATPDRFEELAILASHTGNTSLHSFAAEVRFHALFLLPVPFLYSSALRADLSANGRPLQLLAPYYRPGSRLLRLQEKYHRE